MVQASEVEERHARRLRIWFALIYILGATGELSVWYPVAAVTSWQWVQFLGVGVCFLAMMLWVHRPSRVSTVAAYWIVNISVFLALWVTNAQLAKKGAPFQTFAGFKMMLIGGALILPSDLIIGVPMLLAGAVVPSVEWATWPSDWRAHLAPGEPFGTVIYGLVALALYAHRTRSAAMQRQMHLAEAEASSMERIARMSLAVRDLANTPLQTLQAGVELLQRGGPSTPETIERLLRALLRLRELNQMLEPYAASLKWHAGEASLDSIEVLRQQPPSV
jgi:hypothetical protein